MYYNPYIYPYPYYGNLPMYNNGRQFDYEALPQGMSQIGGYEMPYPYPVDERILLKDYGPEPFVVNINEASKQNNTYRTALWTGPHLQVTLMSINVGDDIGLEIHHDVDQFLRVEQGQGIVNMGKSKNNLNFVRRVRDDSAIMVPANTWHNVTNTGNIPLKLYSIYAPPHHPFGTVHKTKADAAAAESEYGHGNRYSD
ncbi:cupin domain-containing protein [Oceanobacillus sp. 143]|uniref:Cupin domain-containing protein n=1 Tax=Oceanobacillus zhaokaii TaxID=2052660 RepID=A0A345PCM5_9BACI|nr:cupin domain-containing protein [Oceanobacillus zhaokaii]AXI07755.1 cupin domain-containing protein [Oceanobacillus zhaokaii]QGS67901.1 cupin domain-containing protein [Oceanobacillus sp. 143]